MPGAIIPDDWDGGSFNCQKIVWPSSVKWRAILRGQITEPERTSFWDPDSGTVEDAVDAVEDAEYLTSPGFWTEDCDVQPGQDIVSTFKVNKNLALGLAAATWTFVPFELFAYEHNSPDFALPISQHIVTNPDLFGLWHYDLTLALNTFNAIYTRVMATPGNITIAHLGSEIGRINLAFDHFWPGAGLGFHVQVWSPVASSLKIIPENCQWNGHFVGPVSE